MEMKQLSKEDILEVSKKHITLLIKSKKVDSSWDQSMHTDIKQQTVNNFKEWVVQYKNTQVQDVAKQTLFIFVDVYGQVLAANHTG
jgi:ethanolamine ammonia-lyase large subunit